MTIKDEILKLIDSAPKEIGEEDEELQQAIVDEFDQTEYDDVSNNKRIKGFIDLAQVNKSYEGKVVSRKKDDQDEDFSEFFEVGDEEEDEEEEGNEEESDEDVSDEEDEEEEDEDDEKPAKRQKKAKGDDISDDEEKDIQLVSSKNDELSKAKAVKTQIKLWDNLMKYRINFQNFLTKVNEFPRFDELNSFENEENKENLLKLRQNTLSVINSISNLNDQMNKIIESTNDNKEETKFTINFDGKNVDSKLKTINEYLEKDYKNTTTTRNSIIQKWYDKTYLASGKGGMKALEKPVLKQLEYVLMDKKRILKRTQLKRTVYNVLTKNDQGEDKQNDEEIFDDLDFYHQFLRELVNLNEDGNLTEKSIQLSKLNLLKKKKTHTKASKGRKLKFDTHKPLVNFMAPIYKSQMTDEAKNDLFSSLFQNHPTFNFL